MDWNTFVTLHLEDVKVAADKKHALIAELSEHLRDIESEALRNGCTPREARTRALARLGPWTEHRQQLYIRSRGLLRHRLATIVLPGITAFLTYWGLFFLVLGNSFEIHRGRLLGIPLVQLIPWAMFPAGTLAAYMSRRLGGAQIHQLIASTFPMIWLISSMLVAAATGIPELATPLSRALLWTVPLLIGAVPIVYFKSRARNYANSG